MAPKLQWTGKFNKSADAGWCGAVVFLTYRDEDYAWVVWPAYKKRNHGEPYASPLASGRCQTEEDAMTEAEEWIDSHQSAGECGKCGPLGGEGSERVRESREPKQ